MTKKTINKKLYLESGKEVHFGDEICNERTKTTDLGSVKRVTILTITKENVDKLIEKGILTTEKAYKCVENLNDCSKILAEKSGMSMEEVDKFMTTTLKLYPAAALSIMLRVIALDFEHKYKGHISENKTVFVAGITDAKIHELDASKVTNWGHFAAFRTEEDCRKALSIVHPIVEVMYGKSKNQE